MKDKDHLDFVWVFMSTFSGDGARGAPSGIFEDKSSAEAWIKLSGLEGNLYKFPIGISLTDYFEKFRRDDKIINKRIAKYEDRSSLSYKSGEPYLGYTELEHYFDHSE